MGTPDGEIGALGRHRFMCSGTIDRMSIALHFVIPDAAAPRATTLAEFDIETVGDYDKVIFIDLGSVNREVFSVGQLTSARVRAAPFPRARSDGPHLMIAEHCASGGRPDRRPPAHERGQRVDSGARVGL